MVFGGRGAPYHFRSRIRPDFDRNARVFAALEQTLHELFPVLRRRASRIGGAARSASPATGTPPSASTATTRLAWAGGYVGDGVSTTNLAGRTLADLITATRYRAAPHCPGSGTARRDWEPEPLRWLGANAALQAMTWADHAESTHGTPSRMAALVNGVIGR